MDDQGFQLPEASEEEEDDEEEDAAECFPKHRVQVDLRSDIA